MSRTKPNQQLLTDIALRRVDSRALSIYRARHQQHRDVVGRRSVRVRDFATVNDRDNLAQAISIRLLTQKGELAGLGHPEFGSRLPELIGERRTDTTRNLAKLYVIASLKQERRIEKIVEVTVSDQPGHPTRINLMIRVKPVNDSEVLDLGPFTMAL